MSRLHLALAALLAALALTATAVAAGPAPPKLVGTVGPGYTTLVGTVGPGFTITLTHNGAKLATLKAGKYLLVINDLSTIHNFVLEQQSGGKLEKDLTTVPFTGTTVYTVTLAKGKYKYYCRPHESSMFGFVTVS
jgi:plastocyanin